jgi:hypothetical protein
VEFVTESRFGRDYEPEDRGYTTPCWIWKKWKSKGGYGRKRFGKELRYAHVAYYEQYIGPVPDGFEVDHLCKQRDCVNYEHLEAVTKTENRRRSKPLNGKAKEIRELYATGQYSQQQLADRYDCKQVAISRIILFQSHKD